MKIIQLTITDFLGIAAFKLDKPGKMNVITGPNGAGKTTVLKAIQEAFRGSGVDPTLIKNGAKSGEIFLRLDNGVDIKRKMSASSNTVKVTVNGEPARSPQKFLTDLFGTEFVFNPIDFLHKKKKERVDLLLKAMPITLDPEWLKGQLRDHAESIDFGKIDFSGHGLTVLEGIRTGVYDRRREVNIDVTRLKKSIEQDRLDLPETIDPDRFKYFVLDDRLAALKVAQSRIDEDENNRNRLDAFRNQRKTITGEIQVLEEQLAKKQDALEQITDIGKALAEECNGFVAPAIADIQADITAFSEYQKNAAKVESINRKAVEMEEATKAHQSLDEVHKKLATEVPQALLATVDIPVDGLSIDGDDILIDAVPIDKRSQGESIDLAVRLAVWFSGDLKIICCDGIESLDEDTWSRIQELAKELPHEWFVTKVGITSKLEVEKIPA